MAVPQRVSTKVAGRSKAPRSRPPSLTGELVPVNSAAVAGHRLPARPPSGLAPAAVVALQRTLGNQATGRLLAQMSQAKGTAPNGPIQRQVQWLDGTRTRSIDLTLPLTTFADFGITPTVVNAEEFPGGDASSAISPPTLHVEKAMMGLGSRATVIGEPVNGVEYRMRLPKAPPWQQTGATDMVLSALQGHAPQSAEAGLKRYGKNVPGPTLLKAKGLPTDADFADLVEEHEDHHVEDIKAGVRRVLRPWDAKIKAFKDDNTSFTRTNPEAAKEALYRSAGGTPAEIGQRLVDDFRTYGEGFHKTHEGSSPTIERVDIDEASSTLTIHWKHPLG